MATECARHGYDVIVTGATDRVHASAVRLAEQTGAHVTAVQADLRTAAGVDRVWTAVLDDGRPLEVAMFNAGVSIGGAGFVATDLAAELDEIELNVTSQVRLAKPVVRHMVGNANGRILFTSSLSAWTPTPFETVYGPTRSFIYSLGQSLRLELAGTGVVVTVLLPGATATEFHDRAGMGGTAFGDNSWKNDPAVVARKGFAALMAGRDHVIGTAHGVWRAKIRNRILPDRVKAARHDAMARPN